MRGQADQSETILYGDFRSGRRGSQEDNPLRDMSINLSNLELDLFGCFEDVCGYSGTNTWVAKVPDLPRAWKEEIVDAPPNPLENGLVEIAIALENGNDHRLTGRMTLSRQQELQQQLRDAPSATVGMMQEALVSFRGRERVMMHEPEETFSAVADQLAAIEQVCCEPGEWRRITMPVHKDHTTSYVAYVGLNDNVLGLSKL